VSGQVWQGRTCSAPRHRVGRFDECLSMLSMTRVQAPVLDAGPSIARGEICRPPSKKREVYVLDEATVGLQACLIVALVVGSVDRGRRSLAYRTGLLDETAFQHCQLQALHAE